MELTDLVGEHMLTGVERTLEPILNDHDMADALSFCLDGVTYTATEDYNDGYRSSMREIKVSDRQLSNMFAPQRVVGMYDDNGYNDILKLIDVVTGKVVLEVGTDNSDDYYPCWVASWQPENLATNAG